MYRIQKEIHQFRKRAVKIVAKRYCKGIRKADYDWMTQFEFQFPPSEEVMSQEKLGSTVFPKLHPSKKAEWVHVPDYDEATGEYTKQDSH